MHTKYQCVQDSPGGKSHETTGTRQPRYVSSAPSCRLALRLFSAPDSLILSLTQRPLDLSPSLQATPESKKVLLKHKVSSNIYCRQCQSQVSSLGEKARKLRSDLIPIGTCQPHTTCSWPQPSGPPQSDTCQAHTMRSRPPWSALPHAYEVSVRIRQCKGETHTRQQSHSSQDMNHLPSLLVRTPCPRSFSATVSLIIVKRNNRHTSAKICTINPL
jgi:hypothetical protein